jgi:hypothetical protein
MPAILTIFLMSVPAQGQVTRYVDDANCPGPGAGTQVDPFCTIAQGINASLDGDTVLVADGLYTGDGNRDLDFDGKLITVMSENGQENCIIDCAGSEMDPHRAFLFQSGEAGPPDVGIDGFTIINGYVDGVSGGAVYIAGSEPFIRNCTFRNNTASGGSLEDSGKGGAVFVELEGAALIEDSTFIENTAVAGTIGRTGIGGALALYRASANVADSTFLGNMAVRVSGKGGHGGAIGSKVGDLVLTGCRFIDNLADFQSAANGGALTVHSDTDTGERSNTFISDCLFVGNRATYEGGAIRNGASNLYLANSVFAGNQVNLGAAMFLAYTGPEETSRMYNCVVVGNKAVNGAAVGHFSSPNRRLEISNSTVVANEGARGGISNSAGIPGSWMRVWNTIAWGNVPVDFTIDPDSDTEVDYSCTEDCFSHDWCGDGCIEFAPEMIPRPDGTWTIDAVYDPDTGTTTFTDELADWDDGSFDGLFLNPDIAQMLQSVIVSNTETEIEVWGDFADLGLDGTGYKINDYHADYMSPTLDAANNNKLPPDELDLDEDGDTSEPIPIDYDGNLRLFDIDFVDGTGVGTPPLVDMGAFEAQWSLARAAGSRYIAITPKFFTTDDSAIRISSSDSGFSCLDTYVAADGSLVDIEEIQGPEEWGTVYAFGSGIAPETTYEIHILDSSQNPPAFAATTWKFGDVDNNSIANFGDVLLIVQGFQGNFDNAGLEAMDLDLCEPNGVINFADIQIGVQAFQGASYADLCDSPCP